MVSLAFWGFRNPLELILTAVALPVVTVCSDSILK